MGGSGGRGVSMEEHVLLLYRTSSLEEDFKELRSAFNKVIWLLIATVFTITGALIIAALVSLSTQGRIG